MIAVVRIFLAAMLGASLFTAPVRLQPDSTVQTDGSQPIERGTLRLHYVQKPIGYERYQIVHDGAGDGLTLTSDFDFTDRGGRVQLTATLRTKADFTPLTFKASGK